MKRAISRKESAINFREADTRLLVVLGLGCGVAMTVMVLGAISSAFGSTGGEPMTVVKSTVNEVVGVLNDKQTSRDARHRKLISLVSDHFDFSDMARSALGYHWRELSEDQRQRFVPLFTAFMQDAYLNKLDGYAGQTIEFLNETPNGAGYAEVNTRVIQTNGDPPIRVRYLLKRSGDEWKVYDVTVDDISITANYRAQFNRVITNQGFDALINTMRAKQSELSASLGL